MRNLQMQKLNEQEHEKNFSDKNYDLEPLENCILEPPLVKMYGKP